MTLTLTGRDISLERGSRRLQTGLSFRVDGGRALLLTGPNGAGKTTLIRAIAGLVRPTAGEIRLDGGASEASLGEQCHLIGHANAIKPGLTVIENARFWAAYLGGPQRSEAPEARTLEDALRQFHLDELADIPAGYLSAGQKRRLGLARLLLAPRPVWLLDEPTVSLDAASTATLTAVANRHLAGGGLIIAATHLPIALTPVEDLRLAAAWGEGSGGAAADAVWGAAS